MQRVFLTFIMVLWAGLAQAVPVWVEGVARVIDADTLDVDGQRIRLGGIDAPEDSRQNRETCTTSDGRDWPCGAWATQMARDLMEGREMRCLDLGDRSHNRIVARCYLAEVDVALTLLQAGVVRTCPRFAREQGKEDAYLAAEAVAARSGAGLHEGPLNPLAGFCAVGDAPQAVSLVTPPDPACPIKGNVSRNGQIYHLPGQRDYDRVTMRAEGARWFCSEAEAQAAGWRRAQR